MPTPDAFDPNAPAIPDEIRETLFTKPAFALGEPTKALGNALRDNATLRARIAELEAEVGEHAMCPLEQVQAQLADAHQALSGFSCVGIEISEDQWDDYPDTDDACEAFEKMFESMDGEDFLMVEVKVKHIREARRLTAKAREGQ